MRPRQTILTVVVCIALVAATAPVSAEEVYTVDDNTELDDRDAIVEYQDEGVVHADVDDLDMTITVADDQRDAGIDAHTSGIMKTYLRVEYNEGIHRTVRFYVPAEYFTPRLKEGVASETSDDVSAMFEPVAGGDYTAVTIQFRGETDATFSTNDGFGTYLSARDGAAEKIENITGWNMPSLGTKGHTQWKYPPSGALADENATYHIPVDPEHEDPMDMTIQYDNAPETEEQSWMTVKHCEQQVDPVCVTERDGEPVLFSATGEDVPPIRYKHGTDHVSNAKSGWEELKDDWSGAVDRVTGLFGMSTPGVMV